MKSLNLTLLSVVAILTMTVLCIQGCNESSAATYKYNTIEKPLPDPVYILRVRLVDEDEKGMPKAIALITVTQVQYDMLRVGDRLWVDLHAHVIDDTSMDAKEAIVVY